MQTIQRGSDREKIVHAKAEEVVDQRLKISIFMNKTVEEMSFLERLWDWLFPRQNIFAKEIKNTIDECIHIKDKNIKERVVRCIEDDMEGLIDLAKYGKTKEIRDVLVKNIEMVYSNVYKELGKGVRDALAKELDQPQYNMCPVANLTYAMGFITYEINERKVPEFETIDKDYLENKWKKMVDANPNLTYGELSEPDKEVLKDIFTLIIIQGGNREQLSPDVSNPVTLNLALMNLKRCSTTTLTPKTLKDLEFIRAYPGAYANIVTALDLSQLEVEITAYSMGGSGMPKKRFYEFIQEIENSLPKLESIKLRKIEDNRWCPEFKHVKTIHIHEIEMFGIDDNDQEIDFTKCPKLEKVVIANAEPTNPGTKIIIDRSGGRNVDVVVEKGKEKVIAGSSGYIEEWKAKQREAKAQREQAEKERRKAEEERLRAQSGIHPQARNRRFASGPNDPKAQGTKSYIND